MNEDPARSRFFLLSLARLSSIVLVVFGLVIVNGAVASAPVELGYALVLLGLVELALLPRFLARRWRTPPDA